MFNICKHNILRAYSQISKTVPRKKFEDDREKDREDNSERATVREEDGESIRQ